MWIGRRRAHPLCNFDGREQPRDATPPIHLRPVNSSGDQDRSTSSLEGPLGRCGESTRLCCHQPVQQTRSSGLRLRLGLPLHLRSGFGIGFSRASGGLGRGATRRTVTADVPCQLLQPNRMCSVTPTTVSNRARHAEQSFFGIGAAPRTNRCLASRISARVVTPGPTAPGHGGCASADGWSRPWSRAPRPPRRPASPMRSSSSSSLSSPIWALCTCRNGGSTACGNRLQDGWATIPNFSSWNARMALWQRNLLRTSLVRFRSSNSPNGPEKLRSGQSEA